MYIYLLIDGCSDPGSGSRAGQLEAVRAAGGAGAGPGQQVQRGLRDTRLYAAGVVVRGGVAAVVVVDDVVGW